MAEETDAGVKCPAEGPSGTALAPIRMPVWPIEQLRLSFPRDTMTTVSVRLESERDDLRSSEKEDVDLGEV